MATLEEPPTIFYIGVHDSSRPYAVSNNALSTAHSSGYDFLTARITNDAYHSRVLAHLSMQMDSSSNGTMVPEPYAAEPLAPLTPTDTYLAPEPHVSQIIAQVSPWIDLCSLDPLVASTSCAVLEAEVAWAAFCGATNVMLQGPDVNCVDALPAYAHALMDALRAAPFVSFLIRLPMWLDDGAEAVVPEKKDPGFLGKFSRERYVPQGDIKNKLDQFACWDAWNLVRSLCKYNARLSVALIIPAIIPTPRLQSRWFSEPLRILNIPATSFHSNAKGQTAFSQPQKQVFAKYMRLRNPPWILISDVNGTIAEDKGETVSVAPAEHTDPTPAEATQHSISNNVKARSGPGSHLNYIRYLQTQQAPKLPIERFGTGYEDYLQNPLQPLTDNLESVTYEVFEKDPVKYEWYERAIAAALRDWKKLDKPRSGARRSVLVAIVGAGRGPLVTRALMAGKKTGVEVDVWAVEKNANAYVLLQRYNALKWEGRVKLVQSDMRDWEGPSYRVGERIIAGGNVSVAARSSNSTLEGGEEVEHVFIDILVSELLGSFGDNELSPECLDGVQHLLQPGHGISIPSSYTAYLSPIAAPKIHADILARMGAGVAEAAQIPYVVMLRGIDYLSTVTPPHASDKQRQSLPAEARPVIREAWEFFHPLPTGHLNKVTSNEKSSSNNHNARFAQLEFVCRHKGVCHGLAGFFEAVLYEPLENHGANGGRTGHTSAGRTVESARPSSSLEPEDQTTIELSTNPLTMEQKSKDMISWFPMFFPLKNPLYFPDNTLLSVSIWRQTDGRQVWYEWMIESYMLQGSVSSNLTKNVRLGTTELHSSFKNACLM